MVSVFGRVSSSRGNMIDALKCINAKFGITRPFASSFKIVSLLFDYFITSLIVKYAVSMLLEVYRSRIFAII